MENEIIAKGKKKAGGCSSEKGISENHVNDRGGKVIDDDSRLEYIRKQICSLPLGPGVYQFIDEKGNLIYVGKARNLRSRVRQYFGKASSDARFFTHYIKKYTREIKVITTSNDAEALILENNLIKQHHPKFNIKLRDDKDYLCIRIRKDSDFPGLELARRPSKDGSVYFGPFHSATHARNLLRFASSSFGLRSCSDSVFKRTKKPCLQYQIGRCSAPCAGLISKQDYGKNLNRAILLLEGRTETLKEKLRSEMMALSRAMEYEKAAKKRDLIRAIDSLLSSHRVVDIERRDTDVVGIARQMERVVVLIMFIRGGKLIGTREERFFRIGFDDEEVLRSFLVQYYGDVRSNPDEILIPFNVEGLKAIANFISNEAGKKVRISSPRRGKSSSLLAMAINNAQKAVSEWESVESASEQRLEYIASRLRLKKIPRTIECVDVSHTSGKEVAGSIVVMEGCQLSSSAYKRLKVRGEFKGDDFKAMEEVLKRRFERAIKGETKWEPPDLLLIDGGRAHLKLAIFIRDSYGLKDVEIAAIAKDRSRELKSKIRRKVRTMIDGRMVDGQRREEKGEGGSRGFDTIYIQGSKEGIPATISSPLALLVRLRNEAHRFAISYHRKLRGEKMLKSVLLDVPGLGEVRLKKLYEAFRGVGEMRRFSAEQIARQASIPIKVAEEIKKYIG